MTSPTDTAKAVMCSNPNHEKYGSGPTPAFARLSWPDGSFPPVTLCEEDLLHQVETSHAEGHAVLVEPIAPLVIDRAVFEQRVNARFDAAIRKLGGTRPEAWAAHIAALREQILAADIELAEDTTNTNSIEENR